MKLLVGWRDQLAVETLHRSPHRTCKIRNGAGPFALSNLHFIGMINQMIVGERFEKFDGLRLVIVAPSCRLGLTGPEYGGVLGMPLFKRIPVLCVPRIVERPHELKIVLCHVILQKYKLKPRPSCVCEYCFAAELPVRKLWIQTRPSRNLGSAACAP